MQNILKNKTLSILLLLSFIIIGSFLRLYKINQAPYWMDEGYTINAVLSLQEKGVPILDSGERYDCPIYCEPTALIGKTFDNSPLSLRLLALIAGILLIPLIYVSTKNITRSRVIAFASSFFVTFSYLQIAWSRQVRWYTLLSLFTWAAIFFFYKALYGTKHKWIHILLATLFTFLSIKTHSLAYLLPIIFMAWYAIELIRSKKKIHTLYIVATGIALISTFSFVFQKFNIQLHYTLPYYLSFIIRTYWLPLIFAIISIYIHTPYQKYKYLLVFIFIAYLIPLSFLTNIVHYRYIFHVSPVILILGAMGLYEVSSLIKNKYGKMALAIGTLVLFTTIGGGNIFPKTNYTLEADNPKTIGTRPHYAYTPQPDWNAAYDFIKQHKNTDEIIISSMPQFNKIFLKEAGYWLAYNYLGMDDRTSRIKGGKEFYVGAQAISSLEELETTLSQHGGYIIFDFMGKEKIPEEIVVYIEENTELVFNKKTNEYSEVWVYKFIKTI